MNRPGVCRATLGWVDWFNNRRLLGPIGNIPPAEAEENVYAQRDVLDMVARIEAIGLRQTRGGSHKTDPCLPGGLRVDRLHQVRCANTTSLPMRRGVFPLVMDWFTRKVLAWRISNTLAADFCVEALNEADHGFGRPRY
ncbi:hypothetical protein ATI53_102136 [Salipiger aestuarii]|uniref:Integrase-like protein n=1 Tax=Salipiger aestuarii TaxID=568098 RepID=A0A327Y3K4_9RHOB|nr:hypothetical protein [Salipiger aestuarii]RAK15613.1 hypothetical protein ATI53_102136 [Salipiger aestuarii]